MDANRCDIAWIGDMEDIAYEDMRNAALIAAAPSLARFALAQAEELREARARYGYLVLDLLADDDITISRAAELTQISVLGIRQWSRASMQTGQPEPFPFPERRQAEPAVSTGTGGQS